MPSLEQTANSAISFDSKKRVDCRILIVDDNREIHNDFRKILLPSKSRKIDDELDRMEALFDDTPRLSQNNVSARTIVSAHQGEEAIGLVKRSLSEGTPFSLAFIDVRMPPGIDGIETAKAILELDPEIQIVICSAYSDYSWHEIVERLDNSHRFLILKKPFDNIEVRQIASVLHNRWVESRSDILTGVLNRRAFAAHLIQQRTLSSESGQPLACVMVDLDHFKRVNDLYGHLVGDQVLIAASKCLEQQCQSSDLICRYGGEEFCVILPGRTEAQACEWAEMARVSLSQEKVALNEVNIGVTGSFGVVSLNGTEMTDHSLFLDAADQAMFAAKKHGRNQVVAFSQIEQLADGSTVASDLLSDVVAQDIMQPVCSINASDSIEVALQALIGAPNGVVMVENKQGGLVGLLSQQGLLFSMSEKSLDRVSVESSMHTDMICFASDAPVSKINEFLNRVQVPQVVIKQDGEPVGVIGRSTILEWVLNCCPVESNA